MNNTPSDTTSKLMMLDFSKLEDNHHRNGNGEVIEEEEEDSIQTERAAA